MTQAQAQEIQIPFEVEEGEKVKQVEDYPEYLVTSHGRVFSTKRSKFIGNMSKKNGYVHVALTKDNCKQIRKVGMHVLVMESFGPPKPGPGYEVHHLDKHRDNNHIENLQWVTHQENQQDRNPFTENRKQRATKADMERFLKWYLLHEEELGHLSNQQIANRCKEELNIEITGDTVRINRKRWTLELA